MQGGNGKSDKHLRGVSTPRLSTVSDKRIAMLNECCDQGDARGVLALACQHVDRLALVSSFGSESVVLLHLVSQVDPVLPILFIDTGKVFTETRAYRDRLGALLGLRDVRTVSPGSAAIAELDPDGTLHRHDPDACCELRKAAPLRAALAGFNGWISGRKRYQSESRADIACFERDTHTGGVKVNPLAFWGEERIGHYIRQHHLPLHPLVYQGYASIGCAPCTSPVDKDEDARAGRWRGQSKTECGIHFVEGRVVRSAARPST